MSPWRTWAAGQADVLLNAAGITGPLGIAVGEIGLADFDETMAVNLRAPFLTMSALLPTMKARRSGRVVTIGGTHGQRGRPGRAAYVASKWGLRGLHRSAAIEAGPHNVTVNMVMPGPIAVPRMQRAWQQEADETGRAVADVVAAYTARMGGAMGRLNRPEDVAGVVLFLLSPAAANITGQEITVDAGTIV
jgi:3-hydroxybutyrate dehydrogenase/3-oxoacyl-[acyl-carrier protein] reductase